MPWINCACVTGFNSTNAGQRIRLSEKEWLDAASLYVNVKKSNVSFPTAVPLAENIDRTWAHREDDLEIVVCSNQSNAF